jgi:hypothetical protein
MPLTRNKACSAAPCLHPDADTTYQGCSSCDKVYHLTCVQLPQITPNYTCRTCGEAASADTVVLEEEPIPVVPAAVITKQATAAHTTTCTLLPQTCMTTTIYTTRNNQVSSPLPDLRTSTLSSSCQPPNFPHLTEPYRIATPSSPPLLPEFKGKLHEDPTRFIQSCTEALQAQGIPQQFWLHLIKNQLKEEAERWWRDYGEFIASWPQLQTRLQARFAGTTQLAEAYKDLYGSEQKPNQPAEKFLRQKVRLQQRLGTTTTETELIMLLTNQLLPELRPLVRAGRPKDIEELIVLASELEADLSRRGKPKATQATSNKPAYDSNNRPKCYHCPEWHFHKDCPVLQQRRPGNSNSVRTRAPDPHGHQQ